MKRKRTQKRYCFRLPHFPSSAFLPFVAGQLPNHQRILFPFRDLYSDLSDFTHDAKTISNSLDEPMSLLTAAVILPLTFRTTVPLRREYWNKPSVSYEEANRRSIFTTAAAYPSFYSVLVTPLRSKRLERFMAAIALPKTSLEVSIEQFMMCSDFPVDETAACAALYDISPPVEYDWMHTEFIANGKESQSEAKIHH